MAAGSITFSLLMNTASFETDTKRAEKRLKALKKEAADMGKAFGVAIGAGAAAATYALVETIKTMDETGKAAQKVGITTEAFSGLAYAAGLAELEATELTKGLTKLAVEAAKGNEAFDAMGVNVKDAAGNLKSADVLLAEVADKFKTYKDGSEKTALAVELLGEKIGTKMLPMLNGGSAALRDASEEARAFSLIVSTEAAVSADNFNDNLDRLKGGMKGVFAVAAADLLPSLSGLTDEMVRGVKESGGLTTAARIVASGFRLMASAVIIVGGAFKAVGTLVGGIAGFLVTSVSRAVETAAKSIMGMGEAIRLAATGDFAEAGKAISNVASGIVNTVKLDFAGVKSIGDQFANDIGGIAGLVGKVFEDSARAAKQAGVDPSGGIAAPMVCAAESAKAAKDKISQAAKDAIAAQKRMIEEGKRLTESVMTPSEKKDSTVSNVNQLADAGAITGETRSRAIKEAEATYQDYVTAQRQMLTEGLLTEEQEIQASYDRRRKMILALTEATEQEKVNTVAALSEQRDADINMLHYQRYADLLSEEERLTKEYNQRKRKIEDDESLSAESRYGYLTTLSEQYHAKMQELDEADQAKRDALHQAQIDLVSNGFANIAEVTKAFAGEQSKEYQAMFALSKAFAIADITIKQSQAIAKAWGENNYWVAIGLTAGLVGQFAGLISSTNSANFGGARADGGPVNAGRSYLVGERGPEMFSPNEGGRIIPNDAIGSNSSPQSVRIVNAYDTNHVSDFMGSDSGARTIMNVIKRNGATIRALNMG